MCIHRLQEGQVPSCVWSCPAQARIFGDLNDPEGRLVRTIEDRGATRLLEEKGTKPKVYYLEQRRRRSL
jgi:Fe-S-cluster-containing dehydrogenase component